MRPRRCQLPRGTGPSLTRRDLVDRVGLEARVDQDPVDPGRAVLDPAGPEARVDLDPAVLDPVGLADPVDLGLEGLVGDPVDLAVPARTRDLVDLGPAARVDLDPLDLADPVVDLVVLHPVDRVGPADIRGRVDPVGRVGLGLADRADQGMNRADRAVLVDQGMNRAGRVDPAGLAGLADPVERADLVIRAGRHRRRTHREVLSTAVAPRWAARAMCRTVSAHPVMVRRRRHLSADGVGMADLHRERRRLGGMGRRLRVAGTVHRLRVAGTSAGVGRRAT